MTCPPHYAELNFGSVELSPAPATRQYRFVVTGKNARSGGYAINIDRISLFALASESNRTVRAWSSEAGLDRGAGAVALASGGTPAVPVPVPPTAYLLIAALGLLGSKTLAGGEADQPPRRRQARRALPKQTRFPATTYRDDVCPRSSARLNRAFSATAPPC